jgi:tRNA (guanine-N7-)-methyltransferase
LRPNRKAALLALETHGIAREHYAGQNGSLDPQTLFPSAPAPRAIWFEIGFGSGEHLRARLATANPDITGFIGAEPYLNGASAFLAGFDTPPDNVRVVADDALPVLAAMTDQSLAGVYILNPDPWPKKRHHKRRIVNPATLALLARVIAPGGQLTLSTDVPELAEWMREQLAAFAGSFTPTPATLADPHTPPADWPLVTRYMAKGMAAGRPAHYYVYIRQ